MTQKGSEFAALDAMTKERDWLYEEARDAMEEIREYDSLLDQAEAEVKRLTRDLQDAHAILHRVRFILRVKMEVWYREPGNAPIANIETRHIYAALDDSQAFDCQHDWQHFAAQEGQDETAACKTCGREWREDDAVS